VGAEDQGVTVVSVLRVPVRPGAEDELADAYSRLQIFELSRESGGFRRGSLLRPVAAGEPFLVLAEWDDEADYERWLASPVRAGLARHLEPLIDGPLEGDVYEEVVRG
jgi:heme-degrading monooxygenase HmoA